MHQSRTDTLPGFSVSISVTQQRNLNSSIAVDRVKEIRDTVRSHDKELVIWQAAGLAILVRRFRGAQKRSVQKSGWTNWVAMDIGIIRGRYHRWPIRYRLPSSGLSIPKFPDGSSVHLHTTPDAWLKRSMRPGNTDGGLTEPSWFWRLPHGQGRSDGQHGHREYHPVLTTTKRLDTGLVRTEFAKASAWREGVSV